MKKSSFDKLKEISQYHFDNDTIDPRWDTVIELGKLTPNWDDELEQILKDSKPANWETRGFKGEGAFIPKPELEDEEYDLERVGIDPKVIITDLAWKLGPKLQAISDQFGLKDCMNRIHVQRPGQLWHLHIDKLYKWCPENPEKVLRVFIALNDWQPGQFWEYGNFVHRNWKAGDVTTFDWQNVPHSTANAGFHPRVTLQLTGIITDKTEAFLKELSLGVVDLNGNPT
jgi:hypothetical protein